VELPFLRAVGERQGVEVAGGVAVVRADVKRAVGDYGRRFERRSLELLLPQQLGLIRQSRRRDPLPLSIAAEQRPGVGGVLQRGLSGLRSVGCASVAVVERGDDDRHPGE